MTRYRGPAQPFPFAHRSLGEILEQCRRGSIASTLKRHGDPAARKEKARELRQRRDALKASLGWGASALLARIAGLEATEFSAALTGRQRRSWFTLGIIEQAIERFETAARRVGGERLHEAQTPLIQERAGCVVGREGAAPRFAVTA